MCAPESFQKKDNFFGDFLIGLIKGIISKPRVLEFCITLGHFLMHLLHPRKEGWPWF